MSQQPDEANGLALVLARYRSVLQNRNEALAKLSRTSTEMLSVLRTNPYADIDLLLKRRGEECRLLGASFGLGPETKLLQAARRSRNTPGEVGTLAQSVTALHAECEALQQTVLASQSQCEEILKAGIDETARAIRESAQRRRLDAAYGPMTKHRTPVFLDKHQ